MTPIQPIQKSKTKAFGKETLNEFWLETPTTHPPKAESPDYMNRIKTMLDSAADNGVICVFSQELSSRTFCESIARARDNGNRVYILTNNYHDVMKDLEGCLIRHGGSKRIGSFILANPNVSGDNPAGCVFTGSLSDGSINLQENLLLDLDQEQVKTLFRYFCHQFWRKSEKERMGKDEHDTGPAPIDIFPPVEDSCDYHHLKDFWGKDTENATVTTSLLSGNSYLAFSNFSNSTIMALMSGIDSNMVRSLKQKGNEIHACTDAFLINSIKIDNKVWLVPKIDAVSEQEVYSILLNPEQAGILNKHIISIAQGRTMYLYMESETRENLSGKTILPLGATVSAESKRKILAERTIPVQTAMQAELLPQETFESQEPVLNDDGSSISITYKWTNTPFTLPKGSAKHPLYKNWEDEDKAIAEFIDRVFTAISETEKNENKFSKLLSGLFLGKKQKFSEYRSELTALKEVKYSTIQEDELREKINQLNEIRNYVQKDSSEIAEADRKAKIKEQVKRIEKEREELEAELAEKKSTLAALDGQEGNPKDKKVKRNKLINEVNNLEKQIGTKTSTIKSQEGRLNAPSNEAPKNESVLSNLNATGKPQNQHGKENKLPVPVFPHIPGTGELYQHNGQSYLAIKHWEEYDQGKQEAKRLNAKLCAKGENNG